MQKIPLIGEKKRDGECSLMQQLTHPAHPKCSYRLRTCFGGKAAKYEIRAVDKKMQTERNEVKQRQQYRGQSTQGSNYLFRI